MQCTDCLYLSGRADARQAEYLAPFTVIEQNIHGEDIPKVRYSPVCEAHMVLLYENQKDKYHYPFVTLSDGVFHIWANFKAK
jgi:hypothetical protein